MALGEFELIRRYFADTRPGRGDTALGIGDDAALLRPPAGLELAVTTDTLLAGVHFLPGVDPATLGHKVLAVNLSDLAAMGAEPAWCLLALTLPAADEDWLRRFSGGFRDLARAHGVDLVGGDTTRGPLSITVQAIGLVPPGQALGRSGARPGDLIYVSGPLGSAGLGLAMQQGTVLPLDPPTVAALETPQPRCALGRALRGLASACIDVSDGLAADLGHLLTASRVGARLLYEQVPLSDRVRRHIASGGDAALPLMAGDDYELCFTIPRARRREADELLRRLELAGGCIGEVEEQPGLRIFRHGAPLTLQKKGYDHFPSP